MTEGVPHRLASILEYKREEISLLRRDYSLADLETKARSADPARGFEDAMLAVAAQDGNALICEIKRRSPSAGEINSQREPIEAARQYEKGGATCVSILTDGPSFGGSPRDLIETRAAITLPVIRKDFMLDPLQVIESRAMGADAILVIMAAVDDTQALELCTVATSLGMSVLVEAHNRSELDRALFLPSPLIGINNRDLRTFATDIANTETLAPHVPEGRLLISESAIHSPETIVRLRRCGARGFLIGEAAMRSSDPAALVAQFAAAGT